MSNNNQECTLICCMKHDQALSSADHLQDLPRSLAWMVNSDYTEVVPEVSWQLLVEICCPAHEQFLFTQCLSQWYSTVLYNEVNDNTQDNPVEISRTKS